MNQRTLLWLVMRQHEPKNSAVAHNEAARTEPESVGLLLSRTARGWAVKSTNNLSTRLGSRRASEENRTRICWPAVEPDCPWLGREINKQPEYSTGLTTSQRGEPNPNLLACC